MYLTYFRAGSRVTPVELWLSGDAGKLDRRLKALLTALRAFHGKQDVFQEDIETSAEYLEAAKKLSHNGVRHVVFGHTHLAKKVSLPDGGLYLNSGTWANVLRFPFEILTGPDQEALKRLKAFVEEMRDNAFSGYATFRPNFIELSLDADGKVVDIQLREYASNQLNA